MSDPRRASDDLLLRLIRERKHDSEIAVRLGITTGELRERKADLRNRLGTERYASLTGTSGATKNSSRRRTFLWGAGIAAALFALLLVIANIFAGEPGEASVVAVATSTPAPTTAAVAAPSPISVDGRDFADLGRFLAGSGTGQASVGLVSNRAALVAVQLEATSYISSSPAVEWSVTSASRTDAYLRGTLADRQIDLSVQAQGDARVRSVAAGVGPVLELEHIQGHLDATVLIRVTQGGTPLEVRLTDDGRLLLALDPLSPDTVLEAHTGAALDVSEARPFGSIPRTVGSIVQNDCENDTGTQPAVCRVSWHRSNRGFTVPVDGVYSCPSPRSLQFEGGGLRLVFFLRVPSTTSFDCEPSPVTTGMSIVPDGEWIVVALSETGGPISVVVANNGQVFLGTVKGDVSCPCLEP